MPSSVNKPEYIALKQYLLKQYGENVSAEPSNFLALMDWVSSRWAHDGSINSSTMSSLEILMAAKAGRKFSCIEYARVMSDLLTAMGYISRVVGITTKDIAYGSIGEGHAISEVWSNTLQKWIFIDPQFSISATYTGAYLNFYEIYELKRQGKYDAIDFQVSDSYCKVNKRNKQDVMKEYREFLAGYFGYMMFDVLKDGNNILLFYGLDGKEQFLTSQGVNGKTSMFTEDLRDIYFSLNRTNILFDFNVPTLDCSMIVQKYFVQTKQEYSSKIHEFASIPDFTLTFSTNTPWFSYYEIKHENMNEWRSISTSNNYQWKLHDGNNEIFVRSVNQSGIPGIATTMTINYGE